MDKIKISILLDFYGSLLTEKQFMAVNLHYNEDYSLSEISEEFNISRQGVHESIKKGVDNLIYFEEKLKLYEKSLEFDTKIDKIISISKDNKEAVALLNELKAVN